MSNGSIIPTRERPASAMPGIPVLFALLVASTFGVYALSQLVLTADETNLVWFVLVSLFVGLCAPGFYSLQPNEAAAILLFGRYQGTDREQGLRWVWPWLTKTKISMRVRNRTSETLKVNDNRGNPIEIATNVVWRVKDSAQALFDVDNYETFAGIEIDTALRDIAAHYAYDHAEEGEMTLRGDAESVASMLRERLSGRLDIGGLAVDEARISHLAYSPEIAGAMLKRQQAEAVLAARQKIVAGAVSMVESALQQLSERDVVHLDDERKAAMVSNLLVVLCADREAQPVVNTGTLYG
jgi:hypothetical protein